TEVHAVTEALRAPHRVVQGTLRRSAEDSSTMALICAAVPTPDDAAYVVALFGDFPSDLPTCTEAVEIVRKMLAWTAVPAAAGPERIRVLEAIVEAKHEWERTADVLPEL